MISLSQQYASHWVDSFEFRSSLEEIFVFFSQFHQNPWYLFDSHFFKIAREKTTKWIENTFHAMLHLFELTSISALAFVIKSRLMNE